MHIARYAAAAVLPFAVLLAGCDTEDELLKQRLDVARAEEAALQDLKATLAQDAPSLEGPGSVNIFLSDDVINGVLTAADGAVVRVPDLKGVTIKIKAIRTEFKMGYPLLKVDATAAKEGLAAELEVVGAARLMPTIVPGTAGKPTQLELKVHVDSLVPRAKWGPFDFAMSGFVRDLAQVKVNDQLRTVGIIRLPIDSDIPLKVPARQTPVSFTGATATVSTPDLSLNGKASVSKVIVLPDGLHIHGQVSVSPGV